MTAILGLTLCCPTMQSTTEIATPSWEENVDSGTTAVTVQKTNKEKDVSFIAGEKAAFGEVLRCEIGSSGLKLQFD